MTYIEREALIARFKQLTLGENSLIERLFADGVYAVLETFPAADVAPVVRCRECKHYCYDAAAGECCCESVYGLVAAEDECFCSYGEKRED